MMTPPFLRPGDTVAITAPASRVRNEDLLTGVNTLRKWGLKVETGTTLGSSFHNFSAPFEQRLHELQGFLDNPDIACILAARGGYGVSDLIDHLDFTAFRKSPKWIVGFSDLTALLLHLNSLGYEAVHGAMAKTFSFDVCSAEMLRRLLFGESTEYRLSPAPENRPGSATGPALGGNLVLLAHCLGSSSDISYHGRILFLEDVGEKLYHIDRLMVQLKRAGKLERLAGLVAGSFTDMAEPSFGSTATEIILHHTRDFDYPVALGFEFGHDDVNLPVVMGRNYALEVNRAEVSLKMLENDIV